MAKKIDKVEVSVSDITEIVKGYQLPIEKASFNDVVIPLKSCKGLSVKDREAELESRTIFVQGCMTEISLYFLRIGEMLAKIDADFDFTESESLNFYAYCSAKFDLGKTTVNNLISVYQVFAERISAEDKYRSYTYTQLVELLPLAGTEHEEKITPDYSISQIRAFKRELKKKQKGVTEKVRNETEEEKKLNDEVINFDGVSDVRRFLSEYEDWELVGEVHALGISFFGCYLSDGVKGIKLIAEEVTFGKTKSVMYHFVDEPGQFVHCSMQSADVAKMIIDSDYSACLVPFDDVWAKNKAS